MQQELDTNTFATGRRTVELLRNGAVTVCCFRGEAGDSFYILIDGQAGHVPTRSKARQATSVCE